MQTKWENTATRACKDTESFRKNSWVWFWGVEVIGSGALAGLTGGFLWNRSTLSGRIVGFITFGVFVGGIFLIYGLVILWNLFLASYRQRNELRAKVEQYEQEQNHPKSKYYDQIAKETTNKHWENLAILAQELASKMELPFSIDQRYLNLKFDKNDDGIHALMFIDYCNSFDYEISDDYVKSDADWGLYSYLQNHLIAEDNSWMDNMSKFKETVEILHNKLQ